MIRTPTFKICKSILSVFTPTIIMPLVSFSSITTLSSHKNTSLLHMANKLMFSSSTPKSYYQNIQKGSFTGPGFYVQQMMVSCLAIYSYYIESQNQCFLIDPMNQISQYEQLITQRGKILKGVFLTHYHADYIAGHLQLKNKYHCEIYLGPKALPTFGINILSDNQTIPIGNITLHVLHTPGHTQQSSCILLTDSSSHNQCIFTGDTLFLNQVGRPDLAVKSDLSARDLAGQLFTSLQRIKGLGDQVRVYPGHGAGSSCGKNISKGDFCTIGTQKINNYALKQINKQQFIEDVLHQMPQPPQYFPHNVRINKAQPFNFDSAYANSNNKLSITQVSQLFHKQNTTIIDARPRKSLTQGMIKHAIAIDFDGSFVAWVGNLLSPTGKYIIYADDEQRAQESIKRLLRIGYQGISGYFCNTIQQLGKDLEVYKPEFVTDFVDTVNNEKRTIVDVRGPTEWKNGIAVGPVIRLQLTKIKSDHSKVLNKQEKYVVHCQLGYRARIGYSILKSLGYNVTCFADGGYASFGKIGIKTTIP